MGGPAIVTESFPPAERGKAMGMIGAIVLFASLFCFLIGLSLGQQKGFTDVIVLLLLPVSIIFFTMFIVIESRVDQPMINLSLFKNLLLSVNLVTGFISLGLFLV